MKLLHKTELTKIATFRHSVCYTAKGFPEALIVQAFSPTIPKTQFQEMMIAIGDIVEDLGSTKLIFDLRIMTIASESSIDWYTTVWAQRMRHRGLVSHYFVVSEYSDLAEVLDQSKHKRTLSAEQEGPQIQVTSTVEEALEG